MKITFFANEKNILRIKNQILAIRITIKTTNYTSSDISSLTKNSAAKKDIIEVINSLFSRLFITGFL